MISSTPIILQPNGWIWGIAIIVVNILFVVALTCDIDELMRGRLRWRRR